jgi:hypothetical protein
MRSNPLFRHCFALVLGMTSATAWAQGSASPPRTEDALCTAKVLRGAGYRDLAVRFGSRPSIDAAPSAPRVASSYRDSNRSWSMGPLARDGRQQLAANTARTPRRYALQASPSCT